MARALQAIADISLQHEQLAVQNEVFWERDLQQDKHVSKAGEMSEKR